jgi:DNA gyrase subunit B
VVNKNLVYDSSSIEVLEGLEGIRQNPTMYLGSLGSPMLFRMLKELVDNSYDEFIAGRNNSIEVFLDPKDDNYIVADRAGGIPVGVKTLKNGSKINSLTAVFTLIHAGGKNNQDAYKTSAGTHGVGSAAVNACSLNLEVWSFFGGRWSYQAFLKGEALSPKPKLKNPPLNVLDKLKNKSGYGTIIKFSPDFTIISENASRTERKKKSFKPLPAKLNRKDVGPWLRDMSLLNPGLKLVLTQVIKGTKKSKTMVNTKGLDYIPKLLIEECNYKSVGKKPFTLKTDFITVAVQWTDHTDDGMFKSFVNSSPSIDHGTHVTGFKSALAKALKPYETQTKKTKKKSASYKRDDLMMGLVGFLEHKMHGAQFSGQIKDKLESKVDKIVEDIVLDPLIAYFESNPNVAKSIIKRATEFQKQVENLKSVMKSLSDTRKKTKGAIIPEVLTIAPDAKPEERELYIVEGDSAGGTAKNARDPEFQEVLKLRGKPLNAVSASLDKVINNKVIQDLFVALGLELKIDKKDGGIPKFSTSNLRVRGGIIIMPDADPDGFHIGTSLLGFLHKFVPDVFEEGLVYIVDNPLFSIHHKEKFYGDMTIPRTVAQLPSTLKVQGLNTRDLTKSMSFQDMLEDYGKNPEAFKSTSFKSRFKDELHYILTRKERPKKYKPLPIEDLLKGILALSGITNCKKIIRSKTNSIMSTLSKLLDCCSTTIKIESISSLDLTTLVDHLLPNLFYPGIKRIKGLGEMSEEELDYFAMDPNTRRLYKINPACNAKKDLWFTAVVGDDASARRELLGLSR